MLEMEKCVIRRCAFFFPFLRRGPRSLPPALKGPARAIAFPKLVLTRLGRDGPSVFRSSFLSSLFLSLPFTFFNRLNYKAATHARRRKETPSARRARFPCIPTTITRTITLCCWGLSRPRRNHPNNHPNNHPRPSGRPPGDCTNLYFKKNTLSNSFKSWFQQSPGGLPDGLG